MSDLIEFLHARLDEDEQALLGVSDHGHFAMHIDPEWAISERALAEHIVRYNPDRIRRGIEANRRILKLCAGPLHEVTAPGAERSFIPGEGPPWAEPVLRLLALPYGDHPDYRPEWRP